MPELRQGDMKSEEGDLLMKKNRILLAVFAVFIFICSFLSSPAWSAPQRSRKISRYDSNLYKEMEWRCIGPYRGGRVTAVAGIPSQPYTYYFGATGGGVWKTEDGGISWEPISDGFFKTGSVGAIAVSERDPNIVYVGMGETPMRGNVSHGDGMYKSNDAGKTWQHIGLNDTSQISRVRIHPQNPDIVYVAALGHVYGPNEERGVFRSKDGGKTWKKFSTGIKKPVRLIWSWIPQTRELCMLPFGNFIGLLIVFPAEGREAASSNRQMEGIPGMRFPETVDFPGTCWVKSVLQFLRQSMIESGPLSKRMMAVFFAQMMEVKPGGG